MFPPRSLRLGVNPMHFRAIFSHHLFHLLKRLPLQDGLECGQNPALATKEAGKLTDTTLIKDVASLSSDAQCAVRDGVLVNFGYFVVEFRNGHEAAPYRVVRRLGDSSILSEKDQVCFVRRS